MARMDELVSKVNTGSKKETKAKEYARASEWPKCQLAGCPLPTTIKSDRCTCTYHHRENGFMAECITNSIKENLSFINKYNEMLSWNVRTWRERAPQIQGWPVLPTTQEEINLPTIYLNRLKIYIDGKVKERANEIYNG